MEKKITIKLNREMRFNDAICGDIEREVRLCYSRFLI